MLEWSFQSRPQEKIKKCYTGTCDNKNPNLPNVYFC